MKFLRKFVQVVLSESSSPDTNECVVKNGVVSGLFLDEKDTTTESNNTPLKQEENTTHNHHSEQSVEVEKDSNQKIKIGRPPDTQHFFVWLQSMHLSKVTIRGYKYDLGFWEKKAKKINKTPYNLTMKNIEDVNATQDISTAKRRLSMLKTLAKWYLRQDYTKLHLQLQKVTIGKSKERLPKAKSELEFKRLGKLAYELVSKKDRRGLWIGLMLLCGLRVSEIKTTEVYTDTKIKVLGKGDKERLIDAPRFIIEGLLAIPKIGRGAGYVMGERRIAKVLQKDFNLTNPHSLRHTYATFLRTYSQQRVDLDDIQKLLGHTSVATTQIYAKNEVKVNAGQLVTLGLDVG